MPKRRRTARTIDAGRNAGRLAVVIMGHPREFVGIVMATAATLIIFVNALFLQHGPHPAPIIATRPFMAQERAAAHAHAVPLPPRRMQSDSGLVTDIQLALTDRGFYDGAVDGLWGTKTESAARNFVQAAGEKIEPQASEVLLRALEKSHVHATSTAAVHQDGIAQLLAPSKRVLAIQHALSDYGYGQLRPTGIVDSDTRAAIERFERDRQLPVTGRLSDRLVRALAAMTGRPLE